MVCRRRRWRAPAPYPTASLAPPTMRSDTRSPVRVKCSASAAADRTVVSRLLASPSMPPERPWSASPSTTMRTPLSSSDLAVTTCRSPVRSETRQLIRRSRSPGWKPRIPANSDPSPRRRERLAPTSPTGCGASAFESNGAVVGNDQISLPTTRTGPKRKPPQVLVRPTFSSPTRRRPQRRGLTSSAGALPSNRPPTAPLAGCSATCGAAPITRVTCSTSSDRSQPQARGRALPLVKRRVVQGRGDERAPPTVG